MRNNKCVTLKVVFPFYVINEEEFLYCDTLYDLQSFCNKVHEL